MKARQIPLLTIEIRQEQDVVLVRQRVRQVAELLGFDRQNQTRLATAVSEIARNAYEYAQGGNVELLLDSSADAHRFRVRIADQGPGIPHLQEVLDGDYTSRTGLGLGIVGARRLSDRFHIASEVGQGTVVEMEKDLPRRLGSPRPDVAQIARALARDVLQSPFDEVQVQNREMLRALEELEIRQGELDQLNRELSDTNRGVMALYTELDEKAKELERASEMKTSFLSNMSHEFRTPLNSIMGLARLLLANADGPLTAEQEKQVTFIYRSAQQLSEVVNDLLDTAKIEAGKVTVQPQECNITDLFSSLRGVFRPIVGGAGDVALLFEELSELPELYTDEGKVAQILRNLISNALKFTEQGEVRVTAERQPGDTVAFAVTDTGIGIAPEDQTRIFEDFAQVDGIAQRRVKGTGLGLPLSRRLAELLGGTILVTSQPGAGSTFTLTIPIRYTDDGQANEVTAIPEFTAAGGRIYG